MNRKLSLLFFLLIVTRLSIGQVYNPVINYFINGTPTNGIKIKTNIPFQHMLGMPTVLIEGYSYGTKTPIGLTITWYVYNGDFIASKMSSWGGYTPEIKLAEEDEKIIIFINDKQFYDRFSIRAFAGAKGETDAMFTGWTIVDEAISGSIVKTIPYENRFAGNIYFPEGRWADDGDVGIGTMSPNAKLHVKGGILASSIKVEAQTADFVFDEDYDLKNLAEVKSFIEQNKHLPGIPSASQMKESPVDLAEMNKLLLQKVEELTLYLLEQQEQINNLQKHQDKHND